MAAIQHEAGDTAIGTSRCKELRWFNFQKYRRMLDITMNTSDIIMIAYNATGLPGTGKPYNKLENLTITGFH